jgi:uncharacterized membrane protein
MSPGARRWSLRRYLVAGILVWLPIIATVWVVSFLVTLMDYTLLLLPERYQPQALTGFAIPGLGAVLAFVVLLATGLLVTNFVGRRLVSYSEDLLQRIPLVRSVYTGVKGFAETMFSRKGSAFRRVVMVEYPRLGVWSIGFVTADDIAEISAKTGEQQTCVYIPTAPNPTSGLIIMVPVHQVVPLSMSVDAAMKMIVTCGVVVPPPAANTVSALPAKSAAKPAA